MLMRERPDFRVHFSQSQVAASLWDYAEDGLAECALALSETDLRKIQSIAAHFEDPHYPLPVESQRITHNHVTALAAITYFEGQVRPLTRNRRRPEKDRPARFAPSPPDPAAGL